MFDIILIQISSIKRLMKANAIYYILSTLVMTAFLVILGIMVILRSATEMRESQINNVYKDKKLYSLIDSFYDADEFYEFRQHSENVNLLGEFYNTLVQSSNVEFISMFTQPINIEQFQGDEQFFYNSQEFRNENSTTSDHVNVKSIQLNSTAYQLFQLNVERGNDFDWSKVDYSKDTLPVLIGSDYNGVYDIGSRFIGNYYGRNIIFEVIGILESDTFLYYKGDPEFYLDKYIIIPYQEYCTPVVTTDFTFEGILYFAMINGDIITTLDEKIFLKEIKYIANTTGFADFSIVGIPEFTMMYNTMISVINENQSLLLLTMVLLGILITFIQYGMGRLILARRLNVYQTHFLIGDKNYRYIYLKDIMVPYMVALVTSVFITTMCFQNFSLKSTFFIFVMSFSLLALVYYISKPSYMKSMMKSI